MSKADIRSKLLASKKTPLIEVEIDGMKLGVKKPTVSERESLVSGSKGDADLVANAMIKLVVDIESGEHIFDEADKAELLGQEVGGTIDTLGPKIIEAIAGNQDVKKPTESLS